jgi:hypothetical protein
VRLFVRLLRRLLGRPQQPAPRPRPPTDADRLQQVYRETHRQMEDLRRAA